MLGKSSSLRLKSDNSLFGSMVCPIDGDILSVGYAWTWPSDGRRNEAAWPARSSECSCEFGGVRAELILASTFRIASVPYLYDHALPGDV
ncbi:hypothetical protein RRF57_009010 [Xylaria bambusicola]|uniref:Uncharacterized protein n=1 Tax=Xylaria bambusicola TaxID=326684 RepID=A0AAN7UQ95_9PEZI